MGILLDEVNNTVMDCTRTRKMDVQDMGDDWHLVIAYASQPYRPSNLYCSGISLAFQVLWGSR